MKGWLAALLLCGADAAAAPVTFGQAVASLNRKLFIEPAGPAAYRVSDRLLVRYERATRTIVVRKTAAPLDDQGAYIASALAPVWCDIQGNPEAIAALLNRFLTRQMALSASNRSTRESLIGRCRVQAHSEGLRSFFALTQSARPFVWPPKETP